MLARLLESSRSRRRALAEAGLSTPSSVSALVADFGYYSRPRHLAGPRYQHQLSVLSVMIESMFESLTAVDPAADESALIERIAELERVKSAAAAGQARAAAALDSARRAAEAAAGVPAARRARGLANEIALARRDAPARGGRHLGFAKALVHEMPHTLHALESGALSEWRATLIVRESACLEVEDRRALDAELCGDPAGLDGMGDARVAAAAKAIAYRLDPHAVVDRAAKAEDERTVTIRPAPDTMTYLTALLPVAQGVSVYAALRREADIRGDGRSRGQVMADTLVERVTGRAAEVPTPIAVNLVLTDETLLGGDKTPADCAAMAPSRRLSPAQWWCAPPTTDGPGRHCAGSTPIPGPGRWYRWSRARGCFPAAWPPSSSCAISGAALPTATRRSDTATMPNPGPKAAIPRRSTGSGHASAATTPKKPTAGGSAPEWTKITRTQLNSVRRRVGDIGRALRRAGR